MRGAPELSNRFAAVSDTFHMKMIAIVVNLSLLIRVKKKKKKASPKFELGDITFFSDVIFSPVVPFLCSRRRP